MSELKNIVGQRFGRLTVIERAENTPQQQAQWLCKCDCGNTLVVRGADLRNGHTKSCGCIVSELTVAKNTKHKLSHTRLYNVWVGMKQRCNYSKHRVYEYYGGRGIKVCSEWNGSFESFKEWAEHSGYNPEAKRGECTLDRIDVNGNYSPDNCRWVDMKMQNKNQRRNIV